MVDRMSYYYDYSGGQTTYSGGVETAYVTAPSYTAPPSDVAVTPEYAFSNYFTPVDVTQPPADSPLVPSYVTTTPNQLPSGGSSSGGSPGGGPSGGSSGGSQPQQKQQPQQKSNPITEIIKIFNPPANNQTATNSTGSSAANGQASGNQNDIIPGVDNGILIIGGMGILALLAMKHK
jgi:hypothetical protein